MIGDYDIERQKFKVTDGGDFNFGRNTHGSCSIHKLATRSVKALAEKTFARQLCHRALNLSQR